MRSSHTPILLDQPFLVALKLLSARAGVAFNPGPEWSVDTESTKSYLRLCFGSATKEEIDEGVKRFARVCHEQTGIPAFSNNAANR